MVMAVRHRSLATLELQVRRDENRFGMLVVKQLNEKGFALQSLAKHLGIHVTAVRGMIQRTSQTRNVHEMLRKTAEFLSEPPMRLYALYHYNVDNEEYAEAMYFYDAVLRLSPNDRKIAAHLLNALFANPSDRIGLPLLSALESH